MQFTDCQRTENHYYSFSDRTDRNVALTDYISASILDNPVPGGRRGSRRN